MQKLITILLITISNSILSQYNIDSIPLNKKVVWGCEQRNTIVTPFSNNNYLIENTISAFFKKNDYYFSLGIGLIQHVQDINGNFKTLFGGQANVSIDFYNYKNQLYVPLTMSISYYRGQYAYDKTTQALLISGNANIKSGVEYVLLKQLHIYTNFGFNVNYTSNRYSEPNGQKHISAITGGYRYVFDTGVKYFFNK